MNRTKGTDKLATVAIAIIIGACALSVILLILYLVGIFEEWWLILVPLLFVLGIYAATALMVFILGMLLFVSDGDAR